MGVKFKILLWKNLLTEKRMWPFLLAEICAIIIIGVLIIANPSRSLRKFVPTPEERRSVRIHRVQNDDNLAIVKSMYEIETFPSMLAYSPDNEFMRRITKVVAKNLDLEATSRYLPKETFAKVTISDWDDPSGVPPNYTLRIRFPGFFRTYSSKREQSSMWLTRCTGQLVQSLDDADNFTQVDLYIREGFFQLQHEYFMQILEELGGETDFTLNVHTFRYETQQVLCQPTETPNILTLLFYFVFFLPFVNLVWKYGREREENMLAHHWRYGCSKIKYWFSHFVVSFLHFMALSLLFCIFIYLSWKLRPDDEYESDFSIVYLGIIQLLSIIELIIAAMILATLITNATNAVFLALLSWLTMYAMFAILLEYSYEIESVWVILPLVTFFNNGFAYGMRYVVGLTEENEQHIHVYFFVMLASIIFKLITLSLVQHFSPGTYMDRLPFGFCGLRSLLGKMGCFNCSCGKEHMLRLRVSQIVSRDNYQFGPLFGERLLIATKVAKTIKRVGKPMKDVVKKVSLTVFQGEITVLLGHNGCGKTTLLSLLAGWRKPDDGSVAINNFDIAEFPQYIRKADISMPNNTLYDYLTAVEMLQYFVYIKGERLMREQLQEEVKNWLKTVRSVMTAEEAEKKLVYQMNFEQKRLLTLCCVMACGTRIVLLDEPTLHMQTPEQRLYWSILQREKADRAIVVATYSFREAETIGDRIAVLTDGVLKAYGTPMFLKTTFGIGVDLIILKEEDAPIEPITDLIREYIPDAEPASKTTDQIVYKIPIDKRSTFQTLLIHMHKNRTELGVTDARMLSTDLSEVYMSLGRVVNRQNIPEEPQTVSPEYLSKRKRIGQQWSAMFFKKFANQPSTIIPIFMCLFAFLIIFLLNTMLDVLRTRPKSGSGMILGYDDSANERYLSKMQDCRFIGIKHVNIGNTVLRERNHSFIFTEDSFYCSKKINFREYLYEKEHKEMGHLYGVVEINPNNQYDIYINQHIFHSAPLALNLFHNVIFERQFPERPKLIARVILDPQPITSPHATGQLDIELEHLYLPLSIGIIVPLTISTFIFALAEERNQNLLIMMAIAGLRVDIYWLVNLIWDWATFFIYSVLFQIVLVAAFYSNVSIAHTWFIFLISNIYSFPALGSIYFISMFKFFSHYRAYLVACLIHICAGLFAFVIYWDVFMAQNWFFYVLMFSPSFAMLDGVSGVYVMSKFKQNCETRCLELETCYTEEICKTLPECCQYTFLQWGSGGFIRSIVFLALTTCVLILLMCWVEIHRRENKFYVDSKVKQMHTKTYPYDDDDIVRMRDKIAHADLRTITKTRLVVDQVEGSIPRDARFLTTISFEAERENVLAIYGTQHVGKTHICRQIVGEDSFRFGDIYVRGIPVKYNVHEAWTHLGYSPQFAGAFLGFTPIEVFYFFGMLRGVSSSSLPSIVNGLSNLFGLDKVMRRRIKRLSRGTQRKVTIASAFVADNKVIVLDEPTRGLPQWTRREIWNALNYLRSCGKTIVLTTTDMYECDAVANKVLLIDDGEMLAYGGPHYLRHKHVVGFYLEVRLRRDGNTMEEVEENLRLDVENVHRFMMFMHSDSVMLNRIDNCLKFYLPVEKINFNLLYGSLEKNRIRLNIAEYTVSQGNFEEVLSNISSKREHKQTLRLI